MMIFMNGRPNFPKDEDELNLRLAEIEKLINNDEKVSQVNIKFVEAAFKLMEDCDLITSDNVNFLSSAQACMEFNEQFRFPRNPREGALRHVTDNNDVLGVDGSPRFYDGKKRHVELDGQHYLISKDWFGDTALCPSNKRQFFKWLCRKSKKTPPPAATTLDELKRMIEAQTLKINELQRTINELKATVSNIITD